MKVVLVAEIDSSASAGVRLIASKKPRKFATKLTSPQLMESPTPSFAVYMTASSYATNKIGSRKNPCTPQTARIPQRFVFVSST